MAAPSAFDDLLDRSNLTGRQFLIYAGQRLHPGLVLYNSVYAIRWLGLDPARFGIAWQALVDSSDALRIVVEEVDGVPQQRVLPQFRVEIESVDPGSGTSAKDWIEARLKRPLVLTERVFDTALIRTSEGEYVWFLHIHHIVVDGAALQVLIRRVTELYSNGVENRGAFPQFADHAARACAMRKSEEYSAARTYWLEQLKNVPETPHFYGVDAFRNTAQERVILTLSRTTSDTISMLARSLATESMSEHAVLANLFNAAFAAYLARVSGTEQVSIGVTFHNRATEQDRQTIGLFMEVFPISLRVRSDDSLVTLLRQVASCTARALKHRQYSVGHSARAPAFSGLFNYMRALARPLGNLDVRRVHPGHGSNAISLSVEPREGSYDLWFDVSADVAATSSGQRVAEHLRTFLESAIADPQAPLADMSLLSSTEAKGVLAACNGPPLVTQRAPGAASQCSRERRPQLRMRPLSRSVTFG